MKKFLAFTFLLTYVFALFCMSYISRISDMESMVGMGSMEMSLQQISAHEVMLVSPDMNMTCETCFQSHMILVGQFFVLDSLLGLFMVVIFFVFLLALQLAYTVKNLFRGRASPTADWIQRSFFLQHRTVVLRT